MYSLLELGDMPATDAEIDTYASLTEEQQQPFAPFHDHRVSGHAGLDAGPIRRQRAPGSGKLSPSASAYKRKLRRAFLGIQMFTLRREQGRLKELEPVVRYFVQQHTVAGTWRPGLALIYSELGRTQEARAEFEHLAQYDFTDVPRDALWMGCMTYLTDVCTFLGDKARAATLYQLLLPYAGTYCRHWQCRSLLWCSLPLPGGVSHYAGTLGRGGATL